MYIYTAIYGASTYVCTWAYLPVPHRRLRDHNCSEKRFVFHVCCKTFQYLMAVSRLDTFVHRVHVVVLVVVGGWNGGREGSGPVSRCNEFSLMSEYLKHC